MVAIKAAHERLNDKDLWPGLPWGWKDTLRIQDECRQRAIDSGITEEPRLTFAAAREYEKYMQQFPRFGERQKIMETIHRTRIKHSKPKLELTDEEMKYLADRLFGANDELGQNILKKMQLTLTSE
jgi:hypothetical protein